MFGALLWLIALFALCFLLGSIPWGLVISKVFFKKDIRNEGSGNIGTTNAMRSMGKVGGGAVFVLDFGKGLLSGYLATVVAGMLLTSPAGIEALYAVVLGNAGATNALASGSLEALCQGLAFMGCVWGHIFSPWLGFKGGKGIASAIGVLWFTFGPVGFVLELAIFAVLVVATRIVSVGSIASAAACPFFAFFYLWGHWLGAVFVSIGALTVVWAHRGNISRLLQGTERRIGDSKNTK